MSNAVFPVLPGLGWNVTKTPSWSTRIQKAVSGRELRAQLYAAPLYKLGLSFEILRAATAYAELQTLIGFFNNRHGSFDSFLYSDPSDNSVTAQGFGTGDAATLSFQLARTYGGNTEPVMNINGNPSIYVNGALQTLTTHYTISTTGVVTFVGAPANGAVLTWSGNYYYRCRFLQDSADFENFLYRLWSLKKLDLWGCLGNKI